MSFQQFQREQEHWLRECAALKTSLEMSEMQRALAVIIDALYRLRNNDRPLENPRAFIDDEGEMSALLQEGDLALIGACLSFFYAQDNYSELGQALGIVRESRDQRTKTDRNAYENRIGIIKKRLRARDFNKLNEEERASCAREQEQAVADNIKFAAVKRIVRARRDLTDPLHEEAESEPLMTRLLVDPDIVDALSGFLEWEGGMFQRQGNWLIHAPTRRDNRAVLITQPVSYETPADFAGRLEDALSSSYGQPLFPRDVIIPINILRNNHWVVCKIRRTSESNFEVIYADSLGGKIPTFSAVNGEYKTITQLLQSIKLGATISIKRKHKKAVQVGEGHSCADWVIKSSLEWVVAVYGEEVIQEKMKNNCRRLMRTTSGPDLRSFVLKSIVPDESVGQFLAHQSPVKRASRPSVNRFPGPRVVSYQDNPIFLKVQRILNGMCDVVVKRGMGIKLEGPDAQVAVVLALKARLSKDEAYTELLKWLSKRNKIFFDEVQVEEADLSNLEELDKLLGNVGDFTTPVRRSAQFICEHLDRFRIVPTDNKLEAHARDLMYANIRSCELPKIDERLEKVIDELSANICATPSQIRDAVLLALIYKINQLNLGTTSADKSNKYWPCVCFLRGYPAGRLLEGDPVKPFNVTDEQWKQDKKSFDDVLKSSTPGSRSITFMDDLQAVALRVLENYEKCQSQFSRIWAERNVDSNLMREIIGKPLPAEQPSNVPSVAAAPTPAAAPAVISSSTSLSSTVVEATASTETIKTHVEKFFKQPPQNIELPVSNEKLAWPDVKQTTSEEDQEAAVQEEPVQNLSLQERSPTLMAHVNTVKQHFQVFMFILKMKDEYFDTHSKRDELIARLNLNVPEPEKYKKRNTQIPLLPTQNYDAVEAALDAVDEAVRQDCLRYLQELLNVSVGSFGKEKARKRVQKEKLREVMRRINQQMEVSDVSDAQDQGLVVFLNESVDFIRDLAEKIDVGDIKLYKTGNNTNPNKLEKERTRLNQIDEIISQHIINPIDDAGESAPEFNMIEKLNALRQAMRIQRGYVNKGSDFGQVLDVCTPRLKYATDLTEDLISAFDQTEGHFPDGLKTINSKKLPLYVYALSQALKGKTVEEKKALLNGPFFNFCFFKNADFKKACIAIIDQCIVEELSPPYLTDENKIAVLSSHCQGTGFQFGGQAYLLSPTTQAAKILRTLFMKWCSGTKACPSQELLQGGMSAPWMGKWTRVGRTAYVKTCRTEGYNPFEGIGKENAEETFRDYLLLCSESVKQEQQEQAVQQLGYIKAFLEKNAYGVKLSSQVEFEAYLNLAIKAAQVNQEFLSNLERVTKPKNNRFFWKEVCSILFKPNIKLADEATDFLFGKYIDKMLDGAIDLEMVKLILSSNNQGKIETLHQKIVEYLDLNLNGERNLKIFVSFFAYYVRLCREKNAFNSFLDSLQEGKFIGPKWGQLVDELIECKWPLFESLEQQLRLAEQIPVSSKPEDARVLLDFTKRLPFRSDDARPILTERIIAARRACGESSPFAIEFDHKCIEACQGVLNQLPAFLRGEKELSDLSGYSEERLKFFSKMAKEVYKGNQLPRYANDMQNYSYQKGLSELCKKIEEMRKSKQQSEPDCFYFNMEDLFILCSLDLSKKQPLIEELEQAKNMSKNTHWKNYLTLLLEVLKEDPFSLVLHFEERREQLIQVNCDMLMTEYERTKSAEKAVDVYKKIKALQEGKVSQPSPDIVSASERARNLEMGTDRLFRNMREDEIRQYQDALNKIEEERFTAYEQGLYKLLEAYIKLLDNDAGKLASLLEGGLEDCIAHTGNEDLHALVNPCKVFVKFHKFIESGEEADLSDLPCSANLTQDQFDSLKNLIETKLERDEPSKDKYTKMSVMLASYYSFNNSANKTQGRETLITAYLRERESQKREQSQASGRSSPRGEAKAILSEDLLSIRGGQLVLSASLNEAQEFVREYPTSLAFHEHLIAHLNETDGGDFYTIISRYLLSYQHENISPDKMEMVLSFLSNINSFNRQFSGPSPFPVLLSWAYKYFYITEKSCASVEDFDKYFKTQLEYFSGTKEAYELSKDKNFMFLVLLLGQAMYKGEQLKLSHESEKTLGFVRACEDLVSSYEKGPDKKVIHALGLVAKIMKARAECHGKDPVHGLDTCKLYLQQEKAWVDELKTGVQYSDRLTQSENALRKLRAPFLASFFPFESGGGALSPVGQYQAIYNGLLQAAQLAKEMREFEGKSATMRAIVLAESVSVSREHGSEESKIREFSYNQLNTLAKAAAFQAFCQAEDNTALKNLAKLLTSEYKKEIINKMLSDIRLFRPLELMYGDEITALKELFSIRDAQEIDLGLINACFSHLSNDYLSHPVVQQAVSQILTVIPQVEPQTIEKTFPSFYQWIRDEHDIAHTVLRHFNLKIDDFYSIRQKIDYLSGFPLPSSSEVARPIMQYVSEKMSTEIKVKCLDDKIMPWLYAQNPIALYCLKAWITDPDSKSDVKTKSI